MITQNYLNQLLERSAQYTLSVQDKAFLATEDIQAFVYAKLTSKKFRKKKMEPECIVRTKKAIQTKVQKKQPISLVYPQGGYKLWRFPSSPTADWAEFFNISYLLQYVAPIAEAYRPGVQITYYMHTLLMELHDNLTTEEVTAYVNSFEALLSAFRKYLPENVSIKILKDADLYTREEYFSALEKGKVLAEKEYAKLPEQRTDHLARMAKLNIKWDGKNDWTNLSKNEKQKKIYLAALYEMAATSQLDRVFESVKSPENVLAFTIATKDFIGIGSTKASIAKYWVGYGVLQMKRNGFLPVILTPSQYSAALKLKYSKVKIDLFSLPNFDKILVFDQPLSFS